MNQSFNLCIASETVAKDALQLGVSIDVLRRICINVNAKVIRQPALQLQLTYQIILPNQILVNQLHWPIWQQTQVNFTDYLWETTCLECFIAGSEVSNTDITITHQTVPHNTALQHTTSYIEINASPDGRYALYQFESYRNPATLPPVPLYENDGHTRASIDWYDDLKPAMISVESSLSSSPSIATKPHDYERSFSVPIAQLPNQQYAIGNTMIEQIHPCVILWFGETALYFASNHASPPDFHNRDYWSRFEL
ncbi:MULTISPECIES: hypothetical protein [unclassified Psychrobacter]|uniref:hypothetical protein n=1 Tax=unclassified Psychrobacter TaxID=196806 RepID=UPI0025B2C985|nr:MULTISPECIES: hypothetical protein [unclassified Psychrobacter]MDN3453948.1 hypothetical protein [Psychrobacter sp. APC 3350]MDN3502703.1 hypothetical protein [Psychrobacter sp. 5A.1]